MRNADVVKAVETLQYTISKIDPRPVVLESYSPGDDTRRYRVGLRYSDGDTVYPFGERYWLGAGEAYEGIWLLIKALQFAEGWGRLRP